MDAHEAGRISELARSLYEHRLAGSMDEAVDMAQRMMHGDPGTKKTTEESLTNKEKNWLSRERPVPGSTVEAEHPERKVVFEGLEPETELIDVDYESPVEEPLVPVVDVPESEPLVIPSAGSLVGNEISEDAPSEEEKSDLLYGDSSGDEYAFDDACQVDESESQINEQSDLESPSLELAEDEEELGSPDDIDAELSSIKLSAEGAEDRLKDLTGDIKDFKKELKEDSDELDEIQEYLKDLENMVDGSDEAIKKEEAGIRTAKIADRPASGHERSGSEDTRNKQE